MKTLKKRLLITGLLCVFLAVIAGCGKGDKTYITEEIVNENKSILELAVEAYIYGYAPVQVMSKQYNQTNSTDDPVYAPLNELYIDTETATPESALWVSPNVNVLYSSSHMDLSEEPMVLYTPEITDRYFGWEIMDAYTNAFSYVGSRATGGLEGTYAICGPDWEGVLPDGYTQITAPTNNVWMVGRHEVAPQDVDPDDLDTVIALVQESVLLPLSEFTVKDPAYVNPIIDHPDDTIDELDITGIDFFTRLNEWLTANPPPAEDDTIMESLAQMGIGSGYDTDFSSWSESDQRKLLVAETIALDLIKFEVWEGQDTINGWMYHLGSEYGDWGTEYLARAAIARDGLGMNINEEAIYPGALLGPHDESLAGNKSYSLTFTADDLPVPVNDNGFWSLTMYDRETGGLVSNDIDRYTIGSQNDLYYAGDGSLTLYIQSDDPGGDETKNWLPSPSNGDKFYIILRAYYPDEEMYTPSQDPEWTLPALERTDI